MFTPNDADLLNNLGYSLKQSGNLEAAAQHFIQALTLNPRHADAQHNLGLILMDRGEDEAAV